MPTGSEAESKEERYLIVSADGHCGADVLAYRDYLPAKWHSEFDAWAADYRDAWVDLDPGFGGRKIGVSSGTSPANWDSSLRQVALEADGIAGEVLFPNTSPPFFPSGAVTAPAPRTRSEYERRWAGLQAHNRWLVDFCKELPGRRAGMAQIFLNDVSDAVGEIEWIGRSGLTGGVLIPQIPPGSNLPQLHSTVYEPIWAACEANDVTIGHHGSSDTAVVDEQGTARSRLMASIDFPFYNVRTLWQLILAGVFEQYPRLRFVLTELPMNWIPQRLALLDSFYREGKMHGTRMRTLAPNEWDSLKMLPSEYFNRNCFLGVSFMLPPEVEMRHEVGVDRIMWGADFPHGEGTVPWTREALRASFYDVPVDECRAMFGENAAELYRLDHAKLRAVADRIGPTVEEVRVRLDRKPRIPDETNCRIFEEVLVPR